MLLIFCRYMSCMLKYKNGMQWYRSNSSQEWFLRKWGRDQIGSGDKGDFSFINSVLVSKRMDSCISYKINFLKEINFKIFLPCLFHKIVWRTKLYVHRECIIYFLADRACFYPCDLTPSSQWDFEGWIIICVLVRRKPGHGEVKWFFPGHMYGMWGQNWDSGLSFLARLHSMWDLSSLTRDGNRAPCSGSAESNHRTPRKVTGPSFYFFRLYGENAFWTVSGPLVS